MLSSNLTLTAECKHNYGRPYIVIRLALAPLDGHGQPENIAEVNIDATDLKIEE
jgi:hypothetical protein